VPTVVGGLSAYRGGRFGGWASKYVVGPSSVARHELRRLVCSCRSHAHLDLGLTGSVNIQAQ